MITAVLEKDTKLKIKTSIKISILAVEI